MNLKKHKSGIYTFTNYLHDDERGEFKKFFHYGLIKKIIPNSKHFNISECFFSKSKKNVFRGLHFQEPPFDCFKIVTCLSGSALDFVVDIRKNSRYFGKLFSFELDKKSNLSIIIPPGFAHGFISVKDDTVVNYLTSKEYSSKHDKGINFSSFDEIVRYKNLIISKRDLNFPTLSDYDSVF